ncbi:MAG: type VI secretion system baseplate subunit TssF [Planctomycetota bacterium]
MREAGGEFAREYPKIAGRLALDEFACADPYVERLLEGFAFLAARIQLKVDAEFPRFTQSMLGTVYPHYLAPTPSAVIAQFRPDLRQSALDEGYVIPRGTVLKSRVGENQSTPCQYVTAHDVTLLPIRVVEAGYHSRDFAALGLPGGVEGRAAIRLTLECAEGRTFEDVSLADLVLFLRGRENAMRIYEAFLAQCSGLVVRAGTKSTADQVVIDSSHVASVGFEDDEALLPCTAVSFQGYRLLQEYFACSDRFMFVRLAGLGDAAARCGSNRLEIFAVMKQASQDLENAVDASNFALHCTPAANLFRHRADRIHVTGRQFEFHVVPDRARPLDFEVYQVTRVSGHSAGSQEERAFLPFYSATDLDAESGTGGGYYVVRRSPRQASARVSERGARSSYQGSEVFLSLVDPRAAPYEADLKQLSVETLCTNRDLPLQMPVGGGKTDFVLDTGAPVDSVVCVSGPTAPRPSSAAGDLLWKLVNHLSLNYLSLVNDRDGASRLRNLLRLYGDLSDPGLVKQIEGLTSVAARPVVRRLSAPGPIGFARGLEVTLTFDESRFEGTGVFLMGAVLAQFLAKYASINSFVETVVSTAQRGEIIRWQPRTGQRHTL